MVRTEVLRSVGGFEERFTGMFEDQVFRAKMYLAGPTYVSSKVLDRYRRHDASCTATTNRKSSELIRSDYLEWLSNYLRRMGTLDFELRARLAVARLKRKHPRCANLLVRALPAIRLVDRL
jgi:GT2 family glycosyltransferase